MADKDRLSKEEKRQIQSLANGLSIQIEDSLTQILYAHINKEPSKSDITQDPIYIALENCYQESQKTLIETSNSFSEQTNQLKQELLSLKEQLLDEQGKKKSDHHELLPDSTSDEKISQLTKENSIAQQKIAQVTEENKKLSQSLASQQEEVKLSKKQAETLEAQLVSAQQEQENILSRFKINRDKQERDNEQVRETIKYLRDENNEMISENNKEKADFIERINKLELKLTEYRLKFEYAQKQLK